MNDRSLEFQAYWTRLTADDEEVRVEAYREIGGLELPAGNQLLIKGLSDSSPRVRWVVEQTVMDIDDQAVSTTSWS